jgi:tripartite ATP-independent transporter DctM subunit
MIGFIVIVFSLLLVGGTPIGLTLGLTGLFALLRIGDPRLLPLVARRIFSGLNFFPLLAIPFFIMAGEIMNKTGITVHLIRFANVLVGHVRGGLAQVNILASIFFAGITGAAVADAAALGSVLIPAMVQEKYDTGFSAAVTAASSIIGPIIPPSIIMVVYGYTMRVSIAALFAAGVVPGVLIGIALMIMSWFICQREDYGRPRPKATFAELRAVLREGILALIMPAIILGGILSGVFTPTEAAAVAVAYAAFVGFVIFRTLKLRDFPTSFIGPSLAPPSFTSSSAVQLFSAMCWPIKGFLSLPRRSSCPLAATNTLCSS